MPSAHYVRSNETTLVDDTGALLLRGIGLGNWWVREGYMWGFTHPGIQSSRQIFAMTVEALGFRRARQFWDTWDDEWVTDEELHALRNWGFDHVRLPLHWRMLISADGVVQDKGLQRLHRTVQRCQDAGLRLVLDLHAAPGGQTGTNIDDSAGVPELFIESHWLNLTKKLWAILASAFADSTTILAYDLLNEPTPNQWNTAFRPLLTEVYRQLIHSIRSHDTNHLIMLEGSQWATDFSGIEEIRDENLCWQFHHYWSDPSDHGVRQILELRERTGMPLYLGETGENCGAWISAMTATCERNGISWCGWPIKKLGQGPCLFRVPSVDNWDTLQSWNPSGNSLTWREAARHALENALEQSANSQPREEVARAYMRTNEHLPGAAFIRASNRVSLGEGWPNTYSANSLDFENQLSLPITGAPGTLVTFIDGLGQERSSVIPDSGVLYSY